MSYLKTLLGITALEESLQRANDYETQWHSKYNDLLAIHKNLLNNPNEIILKDPNGLVKADLAKIRLFMPTKKYKVGDSIESVAHKAGMEDLYNMILDKIVAPKTSGIG